MKPDFYIFTDASFDKKSKIAVIGFCKLKNLTLIPVQEKVNIVLEAITESNNIRAEIQSALMAIASCPKGTRITLYTDCQTICELPRRREKLEAQNFISKS
jgi:ribonuclease HI